MSSSTKIINVLKDDTLPEILSIFKSSSADEVIFVLPKRSKAFQKNDHFVKLREAADEAEKTVSFLCSDPELNALAEQHNFEVLLSRAPTKSAGKKKNQINVVNQIESFYKQPETAEAETEFEEEEPVSLRTHAAAALLADHEEGTDLEEEVEEEPVARRMAEVVHAPRNEQRSIKVPAARDNKFKLDVRHEELVSTDPLEPMDTMWEAEPAIARQSKIKRVRTPMSRRTRLSLAIGGGLAVLAAIVVFSTTGKAEVTLKPQSTPLNFQLALSISEQTPTIDLVKMSVPGQTLTVQKTVSQTFNATGQKDVAQKARGAIILYNKTSSAQPLVATTRFESSDGHIFHSLTSVTVPAAKSASTPGTAEVQVIADKAGSEYNVPAGNFVVPAFREQGNTAKFQGITGVSTEAMHAGTSGKATVVTESDYNQAKTLLTEKLKTSIAEELKAQSNDLKVIDENNVTIEKPTSDADIDDAATTFTMSLSGTIKTVAFKQSDVDALIAGYASSKYNSDIVAENLSITYNNVKYDESTRTLTTTTAIAGPGYAKIDQAKVIENLLGKNNAEMTAYLKSVTSLVSANVSLSPLWVRSIPQDPSRVHITITH